MTENVSGNDDEESGREKEEQLQVEGDAEGRREKMLLKGKGKTRKYVSVKEEMKTNNEERKQEIMHQNDKYGVSKDVSEWRAGIGWKGKRSTVTKVGKEQHKEREIRRRRKEKSG